MTQPALFEQRAPVRREGEREVPLGRKAQRTRAALLEAAEVVFTTAGYSQTTIADVAGEAGVSLGTVYQYFRDKSDLVAAVVERRVGEMLDATDAFWRASEGRDGLYRVLHNFVAFYAGAGRLAGLWEELTHVDDELAEVRRRIGREFTAVVERELRRAAKAGLVRDDLDPVVTATALAGMVDRYCYVTWCFDPPAGGPPSPADAAAVLTELWASAVNLQRS